MRSTVDLEEPDPSLLDASVPTPQALNAPAVRTRGRILRYTRSGRPIRSTQDDEFLYVNHIRSLLHQSVPDVQMINALQEVLLGERGCSPLPFLPEPR